MDLLPVSLSSSLPERPFGVSRWAFGASLFLALALAVYALANPKYGWDVTTYIGCTFHALEGESWEATHETTYAYLNERFPEPIIREMTTSPPGISPYRSIIATEPEAFRQRLSASCYKVGFMAPVIAMAAIGVDPFWATRITAAVPAALFLLIATIWLCRRIPAYAALPLSLVAGFSGLLQTARYEYPDGLTALCIGGAILAFADRRVRLACGLFLAAMIVRADAILYFGMFLGFAVFLAGAERRLRFLEAIPWGLAALALWFSISAVMETPSFAAAFHHSFISNTAYLLDSKPDLTLPAYLEVMQRQVNMVAGKSAKYPVLIALALLAAALTWRAKEQRYIGEVALLSLSLVVFHFLFIPWFDTRYYAAPYYLITAGFGLALYAVLKNKLPDRRRRGAA